MAGQTKDPSCTSSSFTDVALTDTFCQEIAWTVEAGIANGYPDGTFRPVTVISRQAGADFLYGFAQIPT